MAFNWNIAVKKSGEEWTPLPEEITVKAPLNGRHDVPDLEPLIASILELGQLQPVIIRREEGLPVLFAGFNRWRAITTINKEGRTGPMRPDASVPMRVRAVVRNIGEEEGFFANIAENNIRTPTTALDDAYNLKRLIDGYGLSEEEAAAKYGKTVKWVRNTLNLVQLSKSAQKAYREGRLLGPQAKKLAKLSKEHQDTATAKDGKITADDVRAVAGGSAKQSRGKTSASAAGPASAPTTQENRSNGFQAFTDKLLDAADALAEAIMDDKVLIEDAQKLAEKYQKMRGKS